MCVHCLWGADLDSKISKMWRKNQRRGTERLPGDFSNFSHPHEPNRSNSREKAGFIEDSVWEYRQSCGKTYGRRGVRRQGEGCGTRELWDQEKTWSRSKAEAAPRILSYANEASPATSSSQWRALIPIWYPLRTPKVLNSLFPSINWTSSPKLLMDPVCTQPSQLSALPPVQPSVSVQCGRLPERVRQTLDGPVRKQGERWTVVLSSFSPLSSATHSFRISCGET